MPENYVVYHCHTELSLLDSTTNFQSYIDRAAQLGQRAIAFTEHGNVYNWVAKKIACDKSGIKYIHGVECYLTEKLFWEDPRTGEKSKLRDNYHTVLLAKNIAGLREINNLVSHSAADDHFYYRPRLSFDEFLSLSPNVIKISACLASPLNKMKVSHPMYERLLKHYDFLEIQPHNHSEQIAYNRHLAEMSQKYGIPLIAGTDTHSLDRYKAECRTMLQLAKHIEFADEDSFDLTYKTYDELISMFRVQAALPEKLYLEAIRNTNVMADSVEPFDLDTSFKYPELYGANDKDVLAKAISEGLNSKIAEGAIPPEQIESFKRNNAEECRVFEKIDMSGFMLFMSELVAWCKANDIPTGFNRGSCGGSRVAYVTGTTDLNPETWHTVFSRFANEDRKEIGDIDIDVAPSDRDKIYEYIIDRFGQEKTAYILAVGTVKAKGCVDEICRAFSVRWNKEHQHDLKNLKDILKALRGKNSDITFGEAQAADSPYIFDSKTGGIILPASMSAMSEDTIIKSLTKEYDRLRAENEKIFQKNPWTLRYAAQIKDELAPIDEAAKDAGNPGTSKYRDYLINSEAYKELSKKYPDVFYYFEGMLDVAISQSMHPAGIVASPITLKDNYGTFASDGKEILQIDMNCVHEVGLVKYDILGLKNVEIIKDAYKLIGKQYPKSHEIDWDDEVVWKDMLRSPVGIFQFESAFAFDSLRKFKPRSVYDMSLVTACIRPSGASYRDKLLQRIPHSNPSPIIDELLKDNLGYLIYQEDTIKFLQQVCGLSGSEADNVRRAIGRKEQERLDAALPSILEGYCKKSSQPRSVAEEEVREFLQILVDSAKYQFGYNHSIGYCMIGYLCAYLRCYYPAEFITAYLNNANNEEDIKNGSALAEVYGIQIVPPRFGVSKDKYVCDASRRIIAKGIESIKYMNRAVANELYAISEKHRPNSFMELLRIIKAETSLDVRQLDILIKIDFFRDFGNVVELSRITALFQFFKDGTAKKIQKDKIPEQIYDIVSKYGTDKNKNGTEAKFFAISDMEGLLVALEREIFRLQLPDVDLKTKIQTQFEMMGYIDLTTNKQEDRRKLLITDVFPLVGKDRKEAWGYAVQTRSVGSGKMARLTVRAAAYTRSPIKKFDIVYAKRVEKNKSGYWYLTDYEQVS